MGADYFYVDADYFWSLDYFGGRGLVLGLFSWIILVLGLFLGLFVFLELLRFGLFVFLELLGLDYLYFLSYWVYYLLCSLGAGLGDTYSSRKSGSVIRDANVP